MQPDSFQTVFRNISEAIQGKKNSSVGSVFISVHGVEVLMYKGRSLDDIYQLSRNGYEHPEKAMRL